MPMTLQMQCRRLTVRNAAKLYCILDLICCPIFLRWTQIMQQNMKENGCKKGAAILSRMETDALVEVLHKDY